MTKNDFNISYDAFKKGPSLSFDKNANSFTFKGIEITVGEAIFLCNSMPQILLKHAVSDPNEWNWIVGTCGGEVPPRKDIETLIPGGCL